MTVSCRNCGYCEVPLTSGVLNYEKIKSKSKKNDPFSSALSLENIFLKLGLISLFVFFGSIFFENGQKLIVLSILGCIVFFALFYYIKKKN